MSELFDVLTPDGSATGAVKDRNLVHRDGDWHACAHIWVYNPKTRNVLLQLRRPGKDSYGGYFDVSCAGHLSAGDKPLEAATRELEEELGLRNVSVEYITCIKQQHVTNNGTFIDNEWAHCYAVRGDIDVDQLTLQETEVSGVAWVSLETVCELYRAAGRGDSAMVTTPLLRAQYIEVSDAFSAPLVPMHDPEGYIRDVLMKL